MLKTWKQNVFAGVVTALFSVPEGMAYAKLAGVNPLFGLYSGTVATMVAAVTTGSRLMISTLTSAIALSTKSVFVVAGISPDPSLLFTLTFMVGVLMLVMGLLRLGEIVNFVSHAVMTGFIVGVSLLILIGQMGDLVGITISGRNKLLEVVQWLQSLASWHLPTTAVGLFSVVSLFALKRLAWTKQMASVIVLFLGTALVYWLPLHSVRTVGDLVEVSGGLPNLSLPHLTEMPTLAVGALSVTLVALIQGAGVSHTIGNPTRRLIDPSRDFIGQGLGNLVGAFFQSLSTGGSLSRTAVSVSSGATTRLAGIVSGSMLLLILFLSSHLVEYVPLATMAGILTVIAWELIRERIADVRLILKSSLESSIIMLLTFGCTLLFPLQWAIFSGALLSLTFYIYTSTQTARLVQLIKNDQGYYEELPPPSSIPSNATTILQLDGNIFFAVIPKIQRLMPSIAKTENATLILRVRRLDFLHSTILIWLKTLAKDLHSNGNHLILTGINEKLLPTLEQSGLTTLIGSHNLFTAKPGLGMALDEAVAAVENPQS
ncbi:MAG: SulP family inorganic anion transporter [Chlamydiia bacterium]|nr:SulP family inorganic anion transporter [Chlamydiia bacterium]